MSTQIYRTLIRYAFTAAFGTLVILALTPLYRVGFVVIKRLDRAGICLGDNRYSDAYDELAGLQGWAEKCPEVYVPFSCTEIRCHVRLGNYDEALTCARRAYEVKRGLPVTNLIDRIQWLPNDIIGGYISSTTIGQKMSEWTAFQVLLEELKRSGKKPDELDRVIQVIRGINPDSPVLKDLALAAPLDDAPPAAGDTTPEPADTPAPTPAVARTAAEPADVPAEDDPAPVSDERWGVVKTTTAKSYSAKTGKAGSTVAIGTLADVKETRKTKSGTLYVCDIASKTGSVNRVILLEKDLEIYLDAFSSVPTNVRAATARVYQLRGQVEKRTVELERQNNPHTRTLDAARSAYEAFGKQVVDLKKKRDKSKGDEHVRLSDQLATMRAQAGKLEEKYTTAKDRYDTWKDEHPLDSHSDPKLAHYIALLEQAEKDRENALMQP